ncbi:MAG: hypothetical protein CFE44_03635 [Burkholderiales bacterium PBB4]|nr:MAG: hypothetical protein CFE44_03635 [Burkholderiales bacterium PBB4]
MNTPRRPEPPPPQGSDGTPSWRPSAGLLAAAVAIVVTAVSYFVMSPDTPSGLPPVAAAQPAPTAWERLATASALPSATEASTSPRMASSPAPPASPMDGVDPTPDLSNYVNRGETPTMHEVITRLQHNHVQSGLAAFSPPGTRPPKIGLAVPEDLVLPPGYVRHHQATDDGQRIEAILMFAPDHRIVDANQQAIEMPKDRVVPPHLAPPGFPIRTITIPPPRAQ